MDFAQLLAEVQARHLMTVLAKQSGVSYGYITKLAYRQAPIENIRPGTRLLLEQTMRAMLEQAQAEAAAPNPG